MTPTTVGPTSRGPTTAGPTTTNPTTVGPTISPTSGGPTTRSPTTGGPTSKGPTTRSPTSRSPTTRCPVTSSPSTTTPSQNPTSTGPTSRGPTTGSPSSRGPTTCGPTSRCPTTAAPTSRSPSTVSPSTRGPTTVGPTSCGPTTVNPTSSPTSCGPTSRAPTTRGPTTVGPTTSGPTTCGPSTLGPTSLSPSTSCPTQNPTTRNPTSSSPTTAPTTDSPTTDTPTTSNPTSCGPTTSGPTTRAPTSGNPTTCSPTSCAPSHSPTTSNPTSGSPTQNPTTGGPTTRGPTTCGPTSCGPTSCNPSTQGPTSQGPTTCGPSTCGPTSRSPTSCSPTSCGPTSCGPTTLGPTSRSPTTAGPTSVAPTSVPSTGSPSSLSPTSWSPSTCGPTSCGPSTQGPTSQGPTTCGPTTCGPTSRSPTSCSPTSIGPTSCGPTTLGPTSRSPTTAGPTSAAPTSVPSTGSPSSLSPTSWSPSTCGPTSCSPSTQGPTSQGPTTCGPTSQGPTTCGPTSRGPTTRGPTSASPTWSPTTANPTSCSPTYGPTSGKPTTSGPTTSGPTSRGPTTSGPSTSGPTSCGPTTRGPTTCGPSTCGPTSRGPTTCGPTTCGPTTLGPTSCGPTTLGPTSLSPTTSGPTTYGPTTRGPTTNNPTTNPTSGVPTLNPTTCNPTTANPTRNPTTCGPTSCGPTTCGPTTGGPTTGGPTTGGPTTLGPTTCGPTTGAPTTDGPTTQGPTTCGPTTCGPTTCGPTTCGPTTCGPTTCGPTTCGPTTCGPTTQGPTTCSPTTSAPTLPGCSSPLESELANVLPGTCGANTLHLDRCRFACKPGFYPSCDFPTIRCYIGQWIIGQSTCEPAANLVVQGAFGVLRGGYTTPVHKIVTEPARAVCNATLRISVSPAAWGTVVPSSIPLTPETAASAAFRVVADTSMDEGTMTLTYSIDGPDAVALTSPATTQFRTGPGADSPVPSMLSAKIRSDYISMDLVFSMATDRARMAAGSPCSDILSDSTLALLGSGPRCTWTSDTAMLVTTLADGLFLLGSEIGIRAGRLKSKDGWSPYAEAGYALLDPPDVLPRVEAILVGSSTSSNTSATKIGAGASMGGAGKPLKFSWIVRHKGFADADYYERLPRANNESVLVLPRGMPTGHYEIIVRTENWFNQVASSKFKFIMVNFEIPDISMPIFDNSEIDTRLEFMLQPTITFKGAVLNAYWEQITDPRNTSSRATNLTSHAVSIEQPSKYYLYLPPFSLRPDEVYAFKVTAWVSQIVNGVEIRGSESSELIIVKGKAAPLQACIDGSQVSRSEFSLSRPTLALDGSCSKDPSDNLRENVFSFQWTVTLDGDPHTLPGVNMTSKVLDVSSSLLIIGEYRFQLVYSHTGSAGTYRESKATAVVTTTRLVIPIISVKQIDPRVKYNPGEDRVKLNSSVVLQNDVDGQGAAGLTYRWSCVTLDMRDPELFATSPSSSLLVINPVLQGGLIFNFELTVTTAQGVSASARTTVVTNLPPAGTLCYADPSVGIALETVFVLSCDGFTDPDTPLKYGFSADVGGSSIVLTDEAFSNQAETSLPIQPTPTIQAYGNVMDALGAKTSAPFSITVNAPVVLANETESFVEDLVDNKLDKLSEAGDLPSFTVTFMSAVSVLGGPEEPEEPEQTVPPTEVGDTPFPTVAPTPKPKTSAKARKKLLQVLDKIVDASVVTEQTVATQVQFVEALSDSTDLDPEFRENAVGLLSGLVGKIAEGSGSPSSSPISGTGASTGDTAGSETESAKVSAKKQAAVRSAVGAVSNVASSIVDSSAASENQTAYEEETERLGSEFEAIIRQLGRAQAGDMLDGEKPRIIKEGRITIQSQRLSIPSDDLCAAALAAAELIDSGAVPAALASAVLGNASVAADIALGCAGDSETQIEYTGSTVPYWLPEVNGSMSDIVAFSIMNASAGTATQLSIVNLTTPVAARFELHTDFEVGFGPECFYFDFRSGNWTNEGAELVTDILGIDMDGLEEVECQFSKLSEDPLDEPDSYIDVTVSNVSTAVTFEDLSCSLSNDIIQDLTASLAGEHDLQLDDIDIDAACGSVVVQLTLGLGTREALAGALYDSLLAGNLSVFGQPFVSRYLRPDNASGAAPNVSFSGQSWNRTTEVRVVPGQVKSTRKNRMTSFNVRIGVNEPKFDLNAFSYENPMFMLLLGVCLLYGGSMTYLHVSEKKRKTNIDERIEFFSQQAIYDQILSTSPTPLARTASVTKCVKWRLMHDNIWVSTFFPRKGDWLSSKARLTVGLMLFLTATAVGALLMGQEQTIWILPPDVAKMIVVAIIGLPIPIVILKLFGLNHDQMAKRFQQSAARHAAASLVFERSRRAGLDRKEARWRRRAGVLEHGNHIRIWEAQKIMVAGTVKTGWPTYLAYTISVAWGAGCFLYTTLAAYTIYTSGNVDATIFGVKYDRWVAITIGGTIMDIVNRIVTDVVLVLFFLGLQYLIRRKSQMPKALPQPSSFEDKKLARPTTLQRPVALKRKDDRPRLPFSSSIVGVDQNLNGSSSSAANANASRSGSASLHSSRAASADRAEQRHVVQKYRSSASGKLARGKVKTMMDRAWRRKERKDQARRQREREYLEKRNSGVDREQPAPALVVRGPGRTGDAFGVEVEAVDVRDAKASDTSTTESSDVIPETKGRRGREAMFSDSESGSSTSLDSDEVVAVVEPRKPLEQEDVERSSSSGSPYTSSGGAPSHIHRALQGLKISSDSVAL